ncbi:MAG: Cache domain family protein [Acidobacteria bacterium]|nr:MAG: Cache domain family protein [Acidobacteriota bacterium]
MKKLAVLSLFAVFVIAMSVLLFAAERGTPAEAKAMLQKAVAHYKEVGRKQALADFNAKKPPFGDRDLYVVCLGPDHTIIANGGFPQYVGASADALKDANGKSVGKQGWEAASTKGEAAVKYQWINPVTHKMEPKITFFQKVGDDVCGVGAYNP